MTKEMICIVCPMSCHLKVELDDGQRIVGVTGNTCPRGDVYARKELTSPTRMLTSTVRVKGGLYPRLPVITSSDIPKEKLFAVMDALNKVQVTAPVAIGAIIISDVCGLGVDIVASRSMPEAKQ